MMRLTFLLLLAIPVAELYVFIKVQQALARLYDPGSALLLIVASLFASVVFGKWVIRSFGLKNLSEVRDTLQKGAMPGEKLLDGLLLMVAGVAWIIPGYISDGVGLVLLLPPSRRLLAYGLKRFLVKSLAAGQFHVYRQTRAYQQGPSADQFPDPSRPEVIDVTARDL